MVKTKRDIALRNVGRIYDAQEREVEADITKLRVDANRSLLEGQAIILADLRRERQKAERAIENGWLSKRELVVLSVDGGELLRESFYADDAVWAIASRLSARGKCVHLLTLADISSDTHGDFSKVSEWIPLFGKFLKSQDRAALASSCPWWRKQCVLGGRQVVVSSSRSRRLRQKTAASHWRVPCDLAPKAVLSDSCTLGTLKETTLLAVFEDALMCDECDGAGAAKPSLGMRYTVNCCEYEHRLKRLCITCFWGLAQCALCDTYYCVCDECNTTEEAPLCEASICYDCLEDHLWSCEECRKCMGAQWRSLMPLRNEHRSTVTLFRHEAGRVAGMSWSS
eukprot:TRINITY_DN48223_c0_g1_i1.p1 TRINITY_DN48223_c0_g1~~TRINITY_DN48223_c0_g1_i1.p1  ORF type:complete len:340 (+),score=23.17 TRINITY_DN48223_c0_g1_i1:110-1129(+)